MNSWTVLCNIIKFNSKTKGLVVNFSTRPFYIDFNLKKLVGICLYLVPPENDIPRVFTVKKVIDLKDDKAEILFDIEIDKILADSIIGKMLLIDQADYENIINDKSAAYNSLIGKHALNKDMSLIGDVVDLKGTEFQQYVVVKNKTKEYSIPYVEQFIDHEDSQNIVFELPDGLLEIND